jgi:hypothetical protein
MEWLDGLWWLISFRSMGRRVVVLVLMCCAEDLLL